MIEDRTLSGREFRLKPRGAGRFFGAAFLAVWLCGWAVGESIVLWILVRGAYALIRGEPPGAGHAPLQLAPALAIGAFLLFWLALWTLGGYGAIHGLLLQIWAEDHLTVRRDGLRVVHTRGPFRSTREYGRDAIHAIVLLPRGDRLALRTERANVEISQLGTPAERAEAAAAIRTELGLSEAVAEESAALPQGWESVITPEGERAVVAAPHVRATQARVAMGVALAFAALDIVVVGKAMTQLGLVPIAVILAAATAALAWGAVWLSRGRMEWRLGSGRLALARRFGAEARVVFEARRLDLVVTRDSDGDEWFSLEAVAEGEPPPAAVRWAATTSKYRRRIVSVMNDPAVPRQLGAWLARETGLALDDRATPQARQADMRELREQLEKSGAFGRLAGRFIDRLDPSKGRRANGE